MTHSPKAEPSLFISSPWWTCRRFSCGIPNSSEVSIRRLGAWVSRGSQPRACGAALKPGVRLGEATARRRHCLRPYCPDLPKSKNPLGLRAEHLPQWWRGLVGFVRDFPARPMPSGGSAPPRWRATTAPETAVTAHRAGAQPSRPVVHRVPSASPGLRSRSRKSSRRNFQRVYETHHDRRDAAGRRSPSRRFASGRKSPKDGSEAWWRKRGAISMRSLSVRRVDCVSIGAATAISSFRASCRTTSLGA